MGVSKPWDWRTGSISYPNGGGSSHGREKMDIPWIVGWKYGAQAFKLQLISDPKFAYPFSGILKIFTMSKVWRFCMIT
jgi:hypothetical protein